MVHNLKMTGLEPRLGPSRQSKTVLLIASHSDSLLNFRGPLIRDVVALGHRISVAAPSISNAVYEKLQIHGVSVFETPMARTGLNPVRDLKYLAKLKSVVKETQPDLVLTYTVKPNIWGAFAAQSGRVQSVAMVTGLGYAFTDNGNRSLLSKLVGIVVSRLYRMATNRNRLIIFQNPDDRDDFIAAGCLHDKGKARLVNGSGVDIEYFAPALLPDKPVFLMISRLLGNKGVREYCKAAIITMKTRPQARFLLVGYIDEGADGIAQSEVDNWIESGIEYKGPQTDVRPYISEASVFVLPSYREGTPRAVLEAMSMGRPIITSDAPGCRETVKDGETGFLVPIRNVDALAEKMKWLIDHPEDRVRMGRNSLDYARKKYDVSKVNRALMHHLGLI